MAPHSSTLRLENPMDRGAWKAAVHGIAEGRTRLSNFTFTFHFHALEKEMATHSSVLAQRIPGTGEPGGLPSMGLHRVRYNWSDLASAAADFILSVLCLPGNLKHLSLPLSFFYPTLEFTALFFCCCFNIIFVVLGDFQESWVEVKLTLCVLDPISDVVFNFYCVQVLWLIHNRYLWTCGAKWRSVFF